MFEAPDRNTAASLVGVLFAEDFDDEPSAETAQQRDLSPTDVATSDIVIADGQFSADDLTAARQEGFTAGYDAGSVDAKSCHDKAIAIACTAIGAALERDGAVCMRVLEQAVEAAVHLLMETLTALLPATCARNQAREVADVVRRLVGDMTGEAVMRVSVAAALHDDLRAALTSLPPHQARRVVLFPTDDMADGDVRLAWDQGTASFSAGRARRDVMGILEMLKLVQPVLETPQTTPRPHVSNRTTSMSAVPLEEGEKIDA